MDKRYTKHLLFLALFLIFASTGAFAQTITIGAVDAGPYGQGSTIAVPFHVSGGACIQQNNKYNLYLSDASGNFVSGGKLIGSFTGFYIPFINGLIPATTPAGNGYKVIVKSTNPAISSAASGAFSIAASPAVKAAVSSTPFDPVKYPDVFGQCNGVDNNPFTFINQSTPAAAAVTATFFNESLQAFEGGNPAIPIAGYTFNAHATNYTVIVKAANGGIVATKAYQLINNVINSNIGNSGAPPVCLDAGSALSTFNVNILTNTGIQNNYPGNTYVVQWGDGTQTIYTLCDIQSGGGIISHDYKSSSCGITSNSQANSFEIDLQPLSPYCGLSTKSSTYARILLKPKNKITGPDAICYGSGAAYTNASTPGPDPNSNISSCDSNPNAQYEWLVDGVHAAYLKLGQQFNLPAATPAGQHTITLKLLNGNCAAADFQFPVCIQKPPQLNFDFAEPSICLNNGPVTPNNKSVIDNTCNTNNVYTWTITAPAGANPVTYAGGTNANSAQPQFVFSTIGTYDVQLSITTASCGTVAGPTKSIIVNDAPVTHLSGDIHLCGNGQTLIFDNNNGPTKTTLTGTTITQPDTYTWTVTGGAFSYQNGTDSHSHYPQILFNDYGTYTITVVQKNNCGSTQATQKITFDQAPTVIAGSPQSICANTATAPLAGQITGVVSSYAWVGGTGTFTSGRNSLTGNYIPSAAEINAGQVTLTLQAKTSLPAPCNIITSDLLITITPPDNITSGPAPAICTGQPVNYTILANTANSTFTWTASVTSGTATGVPATGSGPVINDVITNTSLTADAVVTYIITPKGTLCTGTPYTLKVVVHPFPLFTASPGDAVICSNQPVNITLSPNIPNTGYTWTSSSVPTGVTGMTTQTSAVITKSIQDIIINNGNLPATVTYIITPYNGTCAGQPVKASVVVQPAPVQADPGQDDEVCNTTTYKLKGNNPAPGTGKWTLASNQAGITFSDDTDPNATVSGLVAGNTYQFKWTITASPTCPPTSNAVTIIIDKATVGGTTAGDAPVCSGDNAADITLTGQTGTILRWESSINNGATWQPIANTSNKQSYLNLTASTQYRAIVQSGKCAFLPSSVTTITVNQPVPVAKAQPVVPRCNESFVTLIGNDPAPFSGTWTQTAGPTASTVIANPNSNTTLVTGLVSGFDYTFEWTIKGIAPCPDSKPSATSFKIASDVVPKFAADITQGCGPTAINFTNISTPSTDGAVFVWDFGDGSQAVTDVNPGPHTFLPAADGSEKKYTVTLTPVSNCTITNPFTMDVLISPSLPLAKIVPSQSSTCGIFNLTVHNVSPGNNVLYEYYLIDVDHNLVQPVISYPDKRDALFNGIDPVKQSNYQIYVVATDKCGTKSSSEPITITATPSNIISIMQIKDVKETYCLGSTVIFQNRSSGGDRFTYSIFDASTNNLIKALPAGNGDFSYTPTAIGPYYVTLTAGTTGCGDSAPSGKQYFTVYPDPQPDFTFTEDNDYNVTFTNTTPDNDVTPATSLTYTWDFGDGSATENTFTPNAHHYDYNKSPFTATLTATNPASKCFAVKKQTIIIKFLGGLYLPNAFMPNSTNRELNTFKAKGNSLKEYSMQIYNNFGQLVWASTRLDSNGSPVEGWDGTYKGVPAQQGIYVWQISATFLDGSKWKGMSYKNSLPKRTGVINLIR